MLKILLGLFYVLIFPGGLFCCAVGLFLAGLDRKLLARMQKRIGPPLLQPFYDFMKLLGKETIIPHNAAKAPFLAAPVLGFASLVTIALFLPIFGFTAFSGVADVVVIIYLLSIPAVALIIGGAASGSPYAGVGISREMVTVLAYELPLVIVLLTVGKKAAMLLPEGGVTFSLAMIQAYQAEFGAMITHWSLLPAAAALLLVIPAEIGSHPFDVAEAETEICEGALAEYSGAPLAMFKLSTAVKMFIMTGLFCSLFLGGAGTGILPLDIILYVLLCAVVTLICVTLIRAVTARLKVEKLFKFYWTFVTGLALVSLILVWFGL